MIELVTEIVEYAHGIAEQGLRIDVAVLLVLGLAVRRHHVAQVQRQRRMLESPGRRLAGKLLILQVGVLDR